MDEFLKLGIGFFVILIGIPIGKFLAKFTKEELKDGKKWFKRIIFVCLILIINGLIFKNDVLLFSSAFIAMVTLQSIK